MGGVSCVGEPDADCLLRIADFLLRISDFGLRIGGTHSGARADRWQLANRIRNPHSAIRNSHRMKFPDRLPIPPEVLKIAQTLEDAGYETWCVGGAIRDNPLGPENHDVGLTTEATPEEAGTHFQRTDHG